MSYITNINTIAKYESILLRRGWFFRVFAILILLVTTIFSIIFFYLNNGDWIIKALPSSIPYFTFNFLNLIQSVVAIFLSSEFLKRDKKLDTSEVFYIFPASNAQYVIGKIWGNLRMFIFLNILVTMIVIAFSLMGKNPIDWVSYLEYFCLILLPSLIFIMGLSSFLMLLLKNQAITFALLLTYIGVSVFYLDDKFYLLLDYMGTNLPLLKSEMVEYTNLANILLQRGTYLFAGCLFIILSIVNFSRLGNAKHARYPWIGAAILFGLLSMGCATTYWMNYHNDQTNHELYLSVNDRWASTPYFDVLNYDIDFNCQSTTQKAKATLRVVSEENDSNFIFTLNPGYSLQSVEMNGEKVNYVRDYQIICVKLGKIVTPKDTLQFTFNYEGRAKEDFSYLDISAKERYKVSSQLLFSIDKRYLFQKDDYILLTPENYWYPRSGVSYSPEKGVLPKNFFSDFKLHVSCKKDLTAISEGECKAKPGDYSYKSTIPLKKISLIVGAYQKDTLIVDSIAYYLFQAKENKLLHKIHIAAKDTFPHLLRGFWDLTKDREDQYPLKRFSMVEVPLQYTCYRHRFSSVQEMQQPGLLMYPEKLTTLNYNPLRSLENAKKYYKAKNDTAALYQFLPYIVNSLLKSSKLNVKPAGLSSLFPSGRHHGSINQKENPYYLYPQIYDIPNNISSEKWPIANECIGDYIKGKEEGDWYVNKANGISIEEAASLLLKTHTFRELLTNDDYKKYFGSICSLMMQRFFAPCENAYGVNEFKDALNQYLKDHKFTNIPFDSLTNFADTLCGTHITKDLAMWDTIMPHPSYVTHPIDYKRIKGKDGEHYVVKFYVTNTSKYDGYINFCIFVNYNYQDKISENSIETYFIPAHTTQEIVRVFDQRPNGHYLDTGISENLPNKMFSRFDDMVKERGSLKDSNAIYTVDYSKLESQDEVIVDNEDTLLFSVTEPTIHGLFPQLLQNKEEEDEFKYKSFWPWHPPLNWTLNIDDSYYGDCRKSAYSISRGNGDQVATWKIPVPKKGDYDLYYCYRSRIMNQSRRSDGEYKFEIVYNGTKEKAFLRNSKDSGWRLLGTYSFDKDTVKVSLSDDSSFRYVVADAVKIVKKQ